MGASRPHELDGTRSLAMASEFDFLVFSDQWGRWPSPAQHLFARIGREHRVLWVEPLGLRAPTPSVADAVRVWDRVGPWIRPPTGSALWAAPPPGLNRLAPAMLPWLAPAPLGHLADRLLVSAVRRRLSTLGFRAPILVTTTPTVGPIVGQLGESAALYYCVDDYALWPGYAAGPIRVREAVLLERADGLLCTAERLREVRARPGLAEGILDHGADVLHFATPMAEPPRLGDVPSPRMLFAGLIDERLDSALLLEVLTRAPEWSLVLLGRCCHLSPALRSHPRVHLREAVPYAELPGWLQAATVLVVPYLRNPQTDTIQPMKMRELLASGRPVVTTGLPEVRRLWNGLVPAHDDPAGFVAALEAARADNPQASALRFASLEGQDWDDRTRSFLDFVGEVASRPRRVL